jgi:hypothetical protein|tara:strand:- start:479 stop:982 length:504 start_codon:yes stop_codon:yes gene_type:complete
MAQYFQVHLRNVLKRVTVTPRDISSGPIYDIRYQKEGSGSKRYLVLSLNVYPYTGSERDKKLHCLDMDNLPLRDVKIILNEAQGVIEEEVNGQMYQEINIPDGRENIQFYQKRIAAITRQIPNLYKTFSLSKIKRVELCDYNFVKAVDPATAKKWGLYRAGDQTELF